MKIENIDDVYKIIHQMNIMKKSLGHVQKLDPDEKVGLKINGVGDEYGSLGFIIDARDLISLLKVNIKKQEEQLRDLGVEL